MDPEEERRRLEAAVAAATSGNVAESIRASVVDSVAASIRDSVSPEVLAQMEAMFRDVSAAVDPIAMATEAAIATTMRRIGSNGDVLPMFRLLFREGRCRDCREISHRWVCACGLERALSDEFYIVDRYTPVRWTPTGPFPRIVGLGSFDLYRIRESARAAELADENDAGFGFGGGSGSGYGFGNGAGWGGGWDDVNGINDAFTASYMNDAAAAGADAAGFDEAALAGADAASEYDYGAAAAADASAAEPPVYFTTVTDAEARENLVTMIIESFEFQSRR